MKRFVIVLLVLIATAAFALERHPNLIYRARREALAKKANGAPIVVFAATESDLTEALTGFRQDEDFWYLTGVNEPGAAVLIVPALDEAAVKAMNAQLPPGRPATLKPRPYSEVLLLPQRNRAAERWTGPKLGPGDPETTKSTGFARVVPLDALHDEIANVISPLGGAVLVNQGKDAKLALEWLKRGNLSVYSRDVKPLIASLRVVKDAGEIEFIRKATDASVEAHLAAWKAIKPGTGERQIASLMVYEFERRGCERPAYGPIVGAGFHSTVLHYDEDSGPINDGDVTHDYRDAVHQHIGDAGGVVVRVFVGGVVPHLLGVEHHDVRPVALAQFAAAFEVEGVRRQAGHLADGVLQPQHLQLADVPGQHARVVAVAARVGHALAELPQAAVARRTRAGRRPRPPTPGVGRPAGPGWQTP